jgi:hypothetical protein
MYTLYMCVDACKSTVLVEFYTITRAKHLQIHAIRKMSRQESSQKLFVLFRLCGVRVGGGGGWDWEPLYENNSSRRKKINLMMLTWVINKLSILLIFCFYKEYGSFDGKSTVP